MASPSNIGDAVKAGLGIRPNSFHGVYFEGRGSYENRIEKTGDLFHDISSNLGEDMKPY